MSVFCGVFLDEMHNLSLFLSLYFLFIFFTSARACCHSNTGTTGITLTDAVAAGFFLSFRLAPPPPPPPFLGSAAAPDGGLQTFPLFALEADSAAGATLVCRLSALQTGQQAAECQHFCKRGFFFFF